MTAGFIIAEAKHTFSSVSSDSHNTEKSLAASQLGRLSHQKHSCGLSLTLCQVTHIYCCAFCVQNRSVLVVSERIISQQS